MTTATLLIAFVLGLVHLIGVRLTFLETRPRSGWLSAAAGITAGFLFLYLMPELEEFRHLLAERHPFGVIEESVHLVVLSGVVVYYGLEHLAYRYRDTDSESESDESPFGHDHVFWMHMGWYALYNLIIGCLLLYGEQETVQGLTVYGMAMAIHFTVVDAAMRHHHQHVYKATGRWILAAAVLVGWAVGAYLPVPLEVLVVMTAFLAGGMIVIAFKDELPTGRETRFLPFLAGAASSALILVGLM